MNKQHSIIMWVLWFAMFQSAFVYHFIIGDGFPRGENAAEPMATWLWGLCLGPIVAATIVRWWVIPRLKTPASQLVGLIVGMSLAETAIFFEIFLIGPDYPQNQIAVLMVAIVGLIQFVPSYATLEMGK